MNRVVNGKVEVGVFLVFGTCAGVNYYKSREFNPNKTISKKLLTWRKRKYR